MEALVVAVNDVRKGKILQVIESDWYFFDEEVGDGPGDAKLFCIFLLEVEGSNPARVVFSAIVEV